tara:strand:- start:31 stop:876 length:846 start_codon:yes stop_codon:yes gene_type:complete
MSMSIHCLGPHPSANCTYLETAKQKQSLNNYLTNANPQAARIQKFTNLHYYNLDIAYNTLGPGQQHHCNSERTYSQTSHYYCNTCSGTYNYNHNAYVCQGVWYVQMINSDCTTHNSFQLNCENVIFRTTADTKGEDATDMIQKYVAWYYSLSEPSNGAYWSVTTTRPTHTVTYNNQTYVEQNNIVRPHLTVANVAITVQTGHTSNNCYNTPTYQNLKACTPSPIANILNSSLYAQYGGKNYFDEEYDAPGSYYPSNPLEDIACDYCNYSGNLNRVPIQEFH